MERKWRAERSGIERIEMEQIRVEYKSDWGEVNQSRTEQNGLERIEAGQNRSNLNRAHKGWMQYEVTWINFTGNCYTEFTHVTRNFNMNKK